MCILVNDPKNIMEKGGNGLVGIIICWGVVRRRRGIEMERMVVGRMGRRW